MIRGIARGMIEKDRAREWNPVSGEGRGQFYGDKGSGGGGKPNEFERDPKAMSSSRKVDNAIKGGSSPDRVGRALDMVESTGGKKKKPSTVKVRVEHQLRRDQCLYLSERRVNCLV